MCYGYAHTLIPQAHTHDTHTNIPHAYHTCYRHAHILATHDTDMHTYTHHRHAMHTIDMHIWVYTHPTYQVLAQAAC